MSEEAEIFEAFSLCHAIGQMNDGRLIGDPLDIEMFKYAQNKNNAKLIDGSGAILASIKTKSSELQILKRFDFDSKLQRMSVIANTPSGMKAIVKGSPEMISSLSTSGKPSNLNQQVDHLTKQGLRVIAFGTKSVSGNADSMQREASESGLKFIGLLSMENHLKDCSTAVVEDLQRCDVQTIMATGDNILTAISVARQCGIMDPRKHVYYADMNGDQIKWVLQNEEAPQKDIVPDINASQEPNFNKVGTTGPKWNIDDIALELPFRGQEVDSFGLAMTGKVFFFL